MSSQNTQTDIIGPIYYQSPINLEYKNITHQIQQDLKIKGKNLGATLNDHKEYVLNPDNPVYLKIGKRKYILHEYHFHTQQSEHTIDGAKTDAELHYVFMEEHCKSSHDSLHVCDGEFDGASNVLVIGRFVNFDNCKFRDLTELQVKLPKHYFEMDGTLTANSTNIPGNYAPVRFLVGTKPIKFSAEDFNPANSKTSRPLQPSDNRIILYM